MSWIKTWPFSIKDYFSVFFCSAKYFSEFKTELKKGIPLASCANYSARSL